MQKHDYAVYSRTLGLFVGERLIRSVIYYPTQTRKAVMNANNTMYNQEGATEYLERERARWYDCQQFGDERLEIRDV